MGFCTRNCYYLRISKKTVLPLYVYLDERHLGWMSDVVLQHVLSDLRPRILPKLQLEAWGPATKKLPSVDTHRGDTYQFCYFIRNVEPHSVLIKSRKFVTAPPRSKVVPSLAKERPRGAKRKGAPAALTASKVARKRPRRKGKQPIVEVIDHDSDDAYLSDTDSDESMQDVIEGAEERDVFDIEVEEEGEEKPKPLLQLAYQGFGISGKCICVVVEPWPLLPKEKSSSLSLNSKGKKSLSSPSRPRLDRGETPLFLPGDTEPTECSDASFYEVDDEESNEDEDPFSNVLAFSQALGNGGDIRPGAAADDEELDSAVLFGDADEVREL